MRAAPVVVAIVVVLVADAANAADTEFLPSYSLTALYNDNYLLSSNSAAEKRVSGAEVDVEARVKSATQLTKASYWAGVTGNYLPGDTDQQTLNGRIGAQLDHKGQRSRVLLDVSFQHTGIVGSEFASASPGAGVSLGNPGTAGSGRVDTRRNYRDLLQVAPNYSFSLSQRVSIDLDADYNDTGFRHIVAGDQVDYRRALGGAAVSYHLSTSVVGQMRVFAAKFSPAAGFADASFQGATAQLNKDMSQSSRAYVRVGVTSSRPDAVGASPAIAGQSMRQSNWIGGLGTQRNLKRGSVYADATRSVDGNSAGLVIVRDELRVTVTRPFSVLFTPYISVVSVRDKAAARQLFQPRTYAQAVIGIDWQLDRQYVLRGELMHAWQSFKNAGGDAHSNGLRVTFSYVPVSRQ